MDVHEAWVKHWRVSVAVGQGQSVCGVHLPSCNAPCGLALMVVVLLLVVNRHLTELPSERRGAMALVPGAAFTPIYAGKMANHHSEVGRSQSVCGVAILADNGGGVSLLTGVSASSAHTGVFTDGRREHHLYPPCVVSHELRMRCHRQWDGPVRIQVPAALSLGVRLGLGVGLGVVILGLQDKLTLPWMNRHRTDLLLDVLLDVLRLH